MPKAENYADRRALLGAGLAIAAAAALVLTGRSVAAAQRRGASGRTRSSEIFPFGRVDEADLSADDTSLPLRARELIRIGSIGIAREDPIAMAAFFHPDFRFHGPGAELNREQLWAYFAACREAFDDFTVTRQALVSDGGSYVAARTRFAGKFVRAFTGSPEGTIQPNGKRVEYRPINIFRYASNGQLAEEWVQYDVEGFLSQLRAGAEKKPT